MPLKIQIRSRIDKTLHEKLLAMGEELDCEQGTLIRRMIMLGVDTYEEKLGRKTNVDTAKTKLLRAERFSIYANILQLVIASEKLSPDKLEIFKSKAKQLLADRWEFGDDPIDTLLLKTSGVTKP